MTLRWRALWVTVVAVMDGPRPLLAGRVGLALAVLLALSWTGSSLQPGTTGVPPAQPAVQATPQPHGILDGQVPLIRTAARHGQRNRRGFALVAVLAAAVADSLVAATPRPRLARSCSLDRRPLAFGPRAPPFRS